MKNEMKRKKNQQNVNVVQLTRWVSCSPISYTKTIFPFFYILPLFLFLASVVSHFIFFSSLAQSKTWCCHVFELFVLFSCSKTTKFIIILFCTLNAIKSCFFFFQIVELKDHTIVSWKKTITKKFVDEFDWMNISWKFVWFDDIRNDSWIFLIFEKC